MATLIQWVLQPNDLTAYLPQFQVANAWVSGNSYNQGDIVTDGVNFFISLISNNTTSPLVPTETPTWQICENPYFNRFLLTSGQIDNAFDDATGLFNENLLPIDLNQQGQPIPPNTQSPSGTKGGYTTAQRAFLLVVAYVLTMNILAVTQQGTGLYIALSSNVGGSSASFDPVLTKNTFWDRFLVSAFGQKYTQMCEPLLKANSIFISAL